MDDLNSLLVMDIPQHSTRIPTYRCTNQSTQLNDGPLNTQAGGIDSNIRTTLHWTTGLLWDAMRIDIQTMSPLIEPRCVLPRRGAVKLLCWISYSKISGNRSETIKYRNAGHLKPLESIRAASARRHGLTTAPTLDSLVRTGARVRLFRECRRSRQVRAKWGWLLYILHSD